jgi:hypothetical protein
MGVIENARAAYRKQQERSAADEQRDAEHLVSNAIRTARGQLGVKLNPEQVTERDGKAFFELEGYRFLFPRSGSGFYLLLPCSNCDRTLQWGPIQALTTLGRALAQEGTLQCSVCRPDQAEQPPSVEARLRELLEQIAADAAAGVLEDHKQYDHTE